MKNKDSHGHIGMKRKRILIGNLTAALILILGAALWYAGNHYWKQTAQTSVNSINEKNTPKIPESPSGSKIEPDGENSSLLKDNGEVSENNSTQVNNETERSEQNITSDNENPAETPVPEFTLSMVGDMLLHGPVSRSGLQKNGTYNYDAIFQHIKKDIKASDAALVNQEVILAGEKFGISGYPAFNGRFEIGDAIEKAGFNVVLHATNHAMDKGKEGLLSCLHHWRKSHPKVKITGIYDTKSSSQKITYLKRNGFCIAILNYTYGTNGLPLPGDMPYAVNLLSQNKVKKDIQKAKKKADFIVVCPHWGTEYQTVPDDYQKKWGKFFLKSGVNLVIGSHPHVIQPVKWMHDTKGHKMLVYYSLGNYINASSNRYPGMFRQFCGGMAQLKLTRNSTGKAVITDAKFIPLITHWIKGSSVTTYKLADYTSRKAKENYLSIIDKRFSYKKIEKYFKKIIDNNFLSLQ